MSGRAPSAHAPSRSTVFKREVPVGDATLVGSTAPATSFPVATGPRLGSFCLRGDSANEDRWRYQASGGRASPAALDRREKIRQVTNPVERSDPLQPKVNPWRLHRSNPQVSDANAEAGSIPLRLAGSSDLKPPGSGRDSVTAVLAHPRPALHPHCDRPRFSIRRRLFSGPATDEYQAALSRPPVCPVAVRLSETPRPK